MKTLLTLFRTSVSRPLMVLSLIALCLVMIMSPAAAFAKGYATDDEQLQVGMVTALSQDGTPEQPKVERASLENNVKVIGVTTTPESELVTVVSGDQEQVYVQTGGEVDAFVSDINGEVNDGDLLALSPLKGVLMKADDTTSAIVGTALEGFSGKSVETKTVQEDSGDRQVKVATLRINLDYKAPSNQQTEQTDSSLERLGYALTGRDVGEIRVLAAVIIFLIVLVAEGGIIYGAVSSAITALGRNPMARKIILKEMIRVIFIALIVLGLGVLSIYAILWI